MKTTTLKGVWAAINHYYKERRSIDIVSDPMFLKANEMFKGVIVKNKENGLGTIEHQKVIEKTDLHKLEEHFDQTLKLLQEANLFHILYYFARRGHENLKKMTKSTFDISRDQETGCLFLYQKIDKCDKNHKESDTEPSYEGSMYEIPGSSSCPVKLYLLYRAKLNPDLDELWQWPKKNRPVFLLSQLTKLAKFVTPYTNIRKLKTVSYFSRSPSMIVCGMMLLQWARTHSVTSWRISLHNSNWGSRTWTTASKQ